MYSRPIVVSLIYEHYKVKTDCYRSGITNNNMMDILWGGDAVSINAFLA